MLYFLLIPINLSSDKKFSILSLIFISSYLIPLLVLVLLKKFKFIKNFQTESIKERKLPVALMIFLFYFLGNTMNNIPSLRDLSLLFYATSIGLIIIYILFFFKIKASIHLLSLSIPTGFFLVLSTNYSQSYILVIIILIILSGILASARLHLKAHNRTEVYIGFFLGLITPIVLNYIL
nr:hypothetical protein [Polaribacter reichenbachii]